MTPQGVGDVELKPGALIPLTLSVTARQLLIDGVECLVQSVPWKVEAESLGHLPRGIALAPATVMAKAVEILYGEKKRLPCSPSTRLW